MFTEPSQDKGTIDTHKLSRGGELVTPPSPVIIDPILLLYANIPTILSLIMYPTPPRTLYNNQANSAYKQTKDSFLLLRIKRNALKIYQ